MEHSRTYDDEPKAWQVTLFRIAYVLLIVGFIYQTSYLALKVKVGIPPDELHHTHLSTFYKEAPGIKVQDTDATSVYGPMNTTPYLYHLAMGKLAHLNFFGVDDEIFWRFISIALAVFLLHTVLELAREFDFSLWGQLITVVAVANLPMFFFISSAAHYDSLTNLVAARMLLYLVRLMKSGGLENLLALGVFLMAGSLIKISFLPFYLIVGLLVLIIIPKLLPTLEINLRNGLTKREMTLLFLGFIFFLANAQLFGNNIYKYNSIFPSAEQVLGQEKAYINYPQARRDKDLMDTVSQREDLSLGQYSLAYLKEVVATVFGIKAHQVYFRTNNDMKWYERALIPFWVGLGFILLRMLMMKGFFVRYSWAVYSVAAVAIFYLGFLFYDTYSAYKLVRVLAYSLQGRYWFPILPAIALFYAGVITTPKNMIWQILALVWVSAIFISQGFLDIVPKLGPEWFW